jgi:hypothetical protein
LDVHKHELSDQFKATLVAWPYAVGSETGAAGSETVGEVAGNETFGGETVSGETVNGDTIIVYYPWDR